MPDLLTQDHWASCLNQDFELDLGSATPLALRLLSVTGFSHPSDPARKAYSLLFSGPAQPVLPQRTYTLANNAVGAQAVFLVPVGPQENGMAYEAVFN